MRPSFVWTAALVCATWFASPARAQTDTNPPALPLTLDEAIRRALETSHRIAEAEARGDAAQAAASARHAAQTPLVSGLAGYTRTNHVDEFGVVMPNPLRVVLIYPDVPDNYRSRIDLQWPIYTGGRLDALERAARAEASAAAADVETARAELRLEVTRAYWALVTAEEALRVVDESLTQMGAHLRDVRNQLDAGLVPPNQVLEVEAQESRQRMLRVQAAAARDVADTDLARLVGVSPGSPVAPTSSLEPPSPDDRSIGTLLDEARRARPERQALVRRVASASELIDAAAAGKRPTIGVVGGLDYARPNPKIFPREDMWKTSWDAGLALTWSLWDGGRTASDVAQSAASKRAVEQRLAEFDSTLDFEVRQRATELASSRAAIAAAGDAVRSATEARRVVADRFGVGVATSTDLLDAEVVLLQAQLDRTRAIANARLAEARLARALGR